MTIIQGSEAWNQWRYQGLGSSDAAVILGIDKYRTRYELWLEKTGQRPREQKSNWAMERGTNLEPAARAQYELIYDIECPATLAEHATYPYMRASLDGYNAENGGLVLEIKCPGKTSHDIALAGQVPEHYMVQVQHQLLVTGAARAHYVSFDGERLAVVEALPDLPFIAKLMAAEILFWHHVTEKIPVPFEYSLTSKVHHVSGCGMTGQTSKVWEPVNCKKCLKKKPTIASAPS